MTRAGSFTDDFLAFTQRKWIKKCYPPAVEARDVKGNVVMKTLGKYGDESRLKVCSRQGSVEAIVSAGRILIALEAAKCRRRYVYHKCG